MKRDLVNPRQFNPNLVSLETDSGTLKIIKRAYYV